MRPRIFEAAFLAGLCLLTVFAGCDGDGSTDNEGCPEGSLFDFGNPPPCDCVSWDYVLAPDDHYTDLAHLAPDMSASPPLADVDVGQRFRVLLRVIDGHPPGCNQGFTHYWGGNDEIVESTNPAILAFDPDWRGGGLVYFGAAPGRATLKAVDLRTPSGGTVEAPLTVCSEPDAPIDCPERVPLVIRVLSE
jgi:hypothetical protein